MKLTKKFFDRDAIVVAKDLLGKVIWHKVKNHWLAAMIIETEAYYLDDKGGHASLGWTEKRQALFMPAGTIYMYYARGGDSLNISCRGEGNAVLIKSGIPYPHNKTASMIDIMQRSHRIKKTANKLCSGQTLLCKSLGLKVPEWNQKTFDAHKFYMEDTRYYPKKIIQTTRLGIPKGRDEHLPYRFIDYQNAPNCTSNPLTKRTAVNLKIILPSLRA